MKHYFFQLIALMCLLTMCKSSKKVDSSINKIGISIEQDGMTIIPSNGVCRLDKKEFNIMLELPKPMAVVVNASFKNSIATGGKPLATHPAFQKENMMAISLFNEERTLFMSEESSSPWYFENEHSNNFNDNQIQNNRYRCTRTIKYFQENTLAKSSIENIKDPVFLVFAPDIIFEANPDSVEVLGKYLKIEWNETSPEMAADVRVDSLQYLDSIHLEEIKAENAQIAAMDLAEGNDNQFHPLVQNVIGQLEIDESSVDIDFVSHKANPNNPKESILFIPVMVKDDGDYFLLSTYVVIADNETGHILNTYFEPNSIQSDAILLSDISIDTAPYDITDNNRAFGIKVSHRSMSQPNPYSTSALSLYLNTKDELIQILKDYTISEFSGEGDTYCMGEFTDQKKTLGISTKKTNGYYNIIVKDTIIDILRFEDNNGDCDKKEKVISHENTLQFNGETYTKHGDTSPLEVYLFNANENDTKIRNVPDGDPFFHFNEASYYMMAITEIKNGWSKVVKVTALDEDPVDFPDEGGWIKNKYITAGVSRTSELLDTPEQGAGVGIIEAETKVRFVDRYKDWILIESENIKGWIEAKWLCGNPHTTCP